MNTFDARLFILICAIMLPACSTLTDTANLDDPAGANCKSGCNTLTNDGSACLQWPDEASAACKEKIFCGAKMLYKDEHVFSGDRGCRGHIVQLSDDGAARHVP